MDQRSRDIKKIEDCAKNDSEKEVNKFLLSLDLELIDCDAKIRTTEKKEIGEIDGIFKYKDRFLFLVEIDESKQVDTKKQDSFFSKWSDENNKSILIEKYNLLKTLEIIKVFIGFNELKKARAGKPSINHQIKDPTNIILFREDLEYFSRNFKVIGSWTRNDFFSYLGLKNEKISEEIDAIRLSVGGKRAYLCALNAHKLLESCYVSRRLDGENSGYQRVIKSSRVTQISKDIEKSKILAFPNAIILNADRALEKTFETDSKSCRINFPNDFCSNKIIDGQHRLLGFAKVNENKQKEHTLAVIIFENLNTDIEIKTFIDINNTQKKIDPNLLLVLKADFEYDINSKPYDEAIVVNLIKGLNDKNSLLKNKVFLGYNDPRSNKITLTTLVGAILKNNLIGGRLHLLQDNKKNINPGEELDKIFKAIKIELKNYADISKKGFFVSNKGIRIIFRILQIFIRNKNKKLIDSKLSYDDFLRDVNSLVSQNYIKDLEKYYGEGGAFKACEKIMKDLKKKNKKDYKNLTFNLKKI